MSVKPVNYVAAIIDSVGEVYELTIGVVHGLLLSQSE